MKNRVIVIGLDGVTFDILLPLVNKGIMPNLQKLLQESSYGELESTYPPLTCPAWFSFSTGKNPARYGAFNFYMLEKNSYEIFQPTNQIMFSQPELWDILNQAGYRCGIINDPITYPVKPVKDYMIAGFLAPSEKSEYTYPPELKYELDKIAQGYEIDASHGEKDDQVVIDGCFRVLEKHYRVIKYFLENKKTDFFLGVLTSTDRIQHQLLNKYLSNQQEEKQRVAPIIERFFNTLDRYLGDLFNSRSENDWLIVMSDHGFTKRDQGFLINHWLMKEGYLSLIIKKSLFERIGLTQRSVKKFLDQNNLKWLEKIIRSKIPEKMKKIVPRGAAEGKGQAIIDLIQKKAINWSKTKAIALPGGIYINTKNRPEGIVELGKEYEELVNQLLQKLNDFSLQNPDLKIKAFRPQAVYHGPFIDRAPDILYILQDYHFGAITNIQENPEGLTEELKLAHHHAKGIFLIKGPEIKKNYPIKGARIIDLTPTILNLFKQPLPSDLDGRILTEIFEENSQFKNEKVELSKAVKMEKPSQEKIYSEEEEKEIKKRLKGLGYLE